MKPSLSFQFDDARDLRVMMKDEEPWFAATDVCELLTIANTGNALRRLPEEEKLTIRLADSQKIGRGGAQSLTYVSEPGLYRLIFRSDKAEAKQFQDWVFHEVLPAIRKTGRFDVAEHHRVVFGQPDRLQPFHGWVEEFFPTEQQESFDRHPEWLDELAKCVRLAASRRFWREGGRAQDDNGYLLIPARIFRLGLHFWQQRMSLLLA